MDVSAIPPIRSAKRLQRRVLFGVVGFIVFLAWGAGPNGTRTVAHTPLTRAETTGMGGSYAVPRRAAAPPATDAVELSR